MNVNIPSQTHEQQPVSFSYHHRANFCNRKLEQIKPSSGRCAVLFRDTIRMEETSSLIECQRKRRKTFSRNTQWDSQELEYLLQLVVRDVIKRWINSPGRRANKRGRKGRTKKRKWESRCEENTIVFHPHRYRLKFTLNSQDITIT